ncbi:MAG: alcohol dehydrogenase class IV [Kiritimatiellia bacterium]|jgi:alcohol dehydrogenase
MATALGFGSLEQLPDLLAGLGRNILLVTGGESFERSGASTAIAPMMRMYRVTRFWDFNPNPEYKDLLKGARICQDAKADLVLAVGGGSVIDMAKLIAENRRSLSEVCEKDLFEQAPAGAALPLIALPTTAGSGSEATHFAVLYVNGEKYSIASEDIRPLHVIVDPALTRSMSPHLTAVTGLDALAQAIESFWAVGATDESKIAARQAFRHILPHIENAVHAPTDEAREAMSLGAHWAGKAIDQSKTTGAHAMSYGMTSRFGIPHGHAVALTLGHFMAFNADVGPTDCTHPDGPEHVRQTLDELFSLLGAGSAETAREQWLSRMKTLGLPTRLETMGIPAERIEELVGSLNLERAGNNPRLLNANTARELLLAAF